MADTSTLSPTQLLVAAEEAVDSFDLAAAEAILKRALQQHPGSTTAMDMLAELYLQIGRTEEAKSLLEKSIAQKPGYGPKDMKSSSTKWMYYAQIVEGHDAVKSYKKGIEVLQAELAVAKTEMDATTIADVCKQIGAAYAAIAEVYMTDLCFEDGAESQCEASIVAALRVCQTSLEVWQAAANLRLCQNRIKDTKEALGNCIKILKSQEVTSEMDVGNGKAPAAVVASYQTRVAILKLLIEVGMGTEARVLAVRLLAEDDANVEVWYLSGVAAKLCGHLKESKRLLLAALEMLQELVTSPHSSVRMREDSLRPIVEATQAALRDLKDLMHKKKDSEPLLPSDAAAATAPVGVTDGVTDADSEMDVE